MIVFIGITIQENRRLFVWYGYKQFVFDGWQTRWSYLHNILHEVTYFNHF